MEKKAIKFDNEKPNMTHIPKDAMFAMGKAFTYGAKKYADDNYREGMEVRRSLAAALRHIYQALDDGDIDPESGCEHLGSAMASIAMALYTIHNKPEFDDRYFKKKEKEQKTYTEDELNEIARETLKLKD